MFFHLLRLVGQYQRDTKIIVLLVPGVHWAFAVPIQKFELVSSNPHQVSVITAARVGAVITQSIHVQNTASID